MFLKMTGLPDSFPKSKELFSYFKKHGQQRVPYKRVEWIDNIGGYLNKKISWLKSGLSTKIKNIEGESHLNDYKENFTEILKKKGVYSNNHIVLFNDISRSLKNRETDLMELSVDSIGLITGKGEWISVQILVGFLEDVDSLKFQLSGLENLNYNLYYGEFIECKWSPVKKYTQLISDMYIPLKRKMGLFNFPKRIKTEKFSQRSLVLKLFVPRDFAMKKIAIRLNTTSYSSKYSELTTNKIDIFVKDFVFPSNHKLKTFLSYNSVWSKYYYKEKEQNNSVVRNHVEQLYQDEISVVDLFPEDFSYLGSENLVNTNSLKDFILFEFDKDHYDKWKEDSCFRNKLLEFLKEEELKLINKDLIDQSYVLLFDELEKKQDYKLYVISEWLSMNGIRSKQITTSSFKPNPTRFKGGWWPLIQNSTSKDLYVYVSNTTSYTKYGNFFIDIEPSNSRKVFWELYKNKKEGLLYYSLNRWDSNLEYNFNVKQHKILTDNGSVNWNAYTYKDFNGDGQLFYPGDDGEFWPSIRYFNLIDGLEDFTLFKSFNLQVDQKKDYSCEDWLNLRRNLLLNDSN